MLVRLIVLVLLGAVVMMVVRRLKVSANTPRKPPAVEARTVRCAHCQVYLPSNEAVSRDGHHYCSSQHAELARQRS